ncbi:unnamed protein product [Lactuca saligna]|uniref:Uncharacterized protein n=1 Tax=Lactuca saligna TaxID=75948 RepID=A0AA35YGK3_LACSI|nr:unnamed protein product [Lactuca saligna]
MEKERERRQWTNTERAENTKARRHNLVDRQLEGSSSGFDKTEERREKQRSREGKPGEKGVSGLWPVMKSINGRRSMGFAIGGVFDEKKGREVRNQGVTIGDVWLLLLRNPHRGICKLRCLKQKGVWVVPHDRKKGVSAPLMVGKLQFRWCLLPP